MGFCCSKRVRFRTPLHKVSSDIIPDPLYYGIKYVEDNALEFQGLYRVCGSKARIIEMAHVFDRGQLPDFASYGPANTSGLVKYYLAELPEPVGTYARYEDFLEVQRTCDKDEDEGFPKLKQLIDELPKTNRNVLDFMVRHLLLVSSHKESNKMSEINLAIVFSPALFRSTDTSPIKGLQDTPLLSKMMLNIMKHYDYFFES
eukprot:gb/GECH01001656.1/.p1 GENE.gb/GECH01001656.1/~~gb/GECH01001656.1/.p1  ORF type:complete len:202 (+),score=49.20 gb/GECH01001656.1/:1-606(+)